MKTHKTKAGTEIPISNIKGKDYLEVKYRLVWFREEHPDWSIQTQIIEHDQTHTLAKATILDASNYIIATAHKEETKQGFSDHAEKAETGAIGRALGFCGYGTQFAPDFDEGDRLADAPVERPIPNLVKNVINQMNGYREEAPPPLEDDMMETGFISDSVETSETCPKCGSMMSPGKSGKPYCYPCWSKWKKTQPRK